MSAPSWRPRFVSAISSVWAAATASSKNSSKKSPIRKNSRQPGWACLISKYCAITGETAAPAALGLARIGSVIDGGARDGGQRRSLTVACAAGGCEREDGHERG